MRLSINKLDRLAKSSRQRAEAWVISIVLFLEAMQPGASTFWKVYDIVGCIFCVWMWSRAKEESNQIFQDAADADFEERMRP